MSSRAFGSQPTPRTWARVTALFEQAVERSPEGRRALLTELGRTDGVAAAEVASLLEAHDRPGDFLPPLPSLPEPIDLCGRIVGSYRLVRLLGSGGMGTVYLAERSDGTFAKRVAIKLLTACVVDVRDRFLRERDVLARLEHPGIARLLDAGTTTDHLRYLVMEYVEGVPIDRYCAERLPSIDARVALLQQVCAGVAHAHRNLVIHCDLKPENVLVTADGTVKILDFGIARQLQSSSAVTAHRPSTPAYSSPEQLRGEALTTASDIYSLGVLAYVVLTGDGPYVLRSGRIDELMQAVLMAEPRRASQVAGLTPRDARRVRGDLETILAKALAKEPDRRYASVEQLGDDLESFRKGDPVRARPDSITYRVMKAVGRHQKTVVVTAVLGLALIAATIVSAWQASLAQRRFEDLRAFAHATVSDVNDALVPIPGTIAARKLLVETALAYLDRLAADALSDVALREELAAAYIRVGKLQGGAFLPNLGDSAGAIASFRKAIATTGDSGPAALERLRIEALISVAQLSVDPIRAAPEFRTAIAAAQRLLEVDPQDPTSLRLLAGAYHGLATVAHLVDDVDDHRSMALRQIDVRERLRAIDPGNWQDEAARARAIAQLALALDQRGEPQAALAELERAQAALEAALMHAAPNQMLERGLAEIHSRKVQVLLALNRPDEAAREAQSAADLLQPLVASDGLNIQYRADLAFAWLRLGDARLAQGRLDEALDLHRRALAIRRERAERNSGFVFVPWELARSLNSVANLLLAITPPHPDEAATLFGEARALSLRTLDAAPSYTQVRKQLAIAEEGLARAAMARGPLGPGRAHDRRFQSAR